ncbi:unnamed protein product [Rotaria sordida]|uniref:Uncharacterized protein n=1 Tax=Rotaria sordida TaxID=392033 RepID=A0A813QG06_9BILA|nr:unnamed protein product [Rotaria sordida]
MGLSHQKPVVSPHENRKPAIIFITGQRSAGKSTILNMTKFGKFDSTILTIGIDMQKLDFDNISLTVLDEGGRSRSRASRYIHYRRMSGLIFVIDSTDRESIDKTCKELYAISNEEDLRNKSILIFANKQDLPNAMTFDELYEKLNLTKLNTNIKWHLQLSSAIQNQGLHEGFQWLAKSLLENIDPKQSVKDITTITNNFTSKSNLINFNTFLRKLIQFDSKFILSRFA